MNTTTKAPRVRLHPVACLCNRCLTARRADRLDARSMMAVHVMRERVLRGSRGPVTTRVLCVDIGATRRYIETVNGEALL